MQEPSTRLIVKNVPKHVDEKRLRKHFAERGEVRWQGGSLVEIATNHRIPTLNRASCCVVVGRCHTVEEKRHAPCGCLSLARRGVGKRSCSDVCRSWELDAIGRRGLLLAVVGVLRLDTRCCNGFERVPCLHTIDFVFQTESPKQSILLLHSWVSRGQRCCY